MPQVPLSDLEKINDALKAARRHHEARDESNAALHLAPQTRFSPLTSEIAAAQDRCETLIDTYSRQIAR